MAAYSYIMTNRKDGTLYIGVTSDLIKRIYEHKHKITGGFTARYNLDMLVYYEGFEGITEAITREKIMKKLLRFEKLALIESQNPQWRDLYPEICA